MNKKLIAAILCSLSIAFLAAQYGGDKSNTIPAGATPTFTHVQSMTTCSAAAGTSISCSFPSNPTTNDVVCIALGAGFTTGTMGTLTVKDGAATPNTYTNSPSSPYLGSGGFFEPLYAAISCLYVAPSSANKTITASWIGLASNFSDIWGDEWSVSSGSASADNDNAASGTSSGTSINTTPTLTPAVSGEMLYAIVIPGNGIVAPTAGGTLGVWTGSPAGFDADFGTIPEYVLSRSTATPVNYTDTGSSDIYFGIVVGIEP